MTVLMRGFSFVKVSCRLGTAKKHGQIDLVKMAYEDVPGRRFNRKQHYNDGECSNTY